MDYPCSFEGPHQDAQERSDQARFLRSNFGPKRPTQTLGPRAHERRHGRGCGHAKARPDRGFRWGIAQTLWSVASRLHLFRMNRRLAIMWTGPPRVDGGGQGFPCAFSRSWSATRLPNRVPVPGVARVSVLPRIAIPATIAARGKRVV